MTGKDEQSPARFLTPADVAEILSVSPSQVLKYLRDRQLRGMKLPGKGEWRIETSALEEFISVRYRETHQNPQTPSDV
ncbi:MAG: DNA-binding protein [Actinobacteria bacterium]|nr:DNA-binding protein [Actinomycetota bacterium]